MERRPPFDINRILRRYLTDDDLHDMDAELATRMTNGIRMSGAVMVAPGESVQRIREPLSEEEAARFGDFALEALLRTDLYMDPQDLQPHSL